MSDEDLQRIPYSELWWSELGTVCRQYHPGAPPPRPVRRRHRAPAPLTVPPPEPPAPDPNGDPPRA